MPTTYELRDFSDIYNAVIEELGIQSSDTPAINRIKRDINAIYLEEVCPAAQWKWLRSTIDLTHPASIETGTVAVTANSVTITFSSAPTNSVKGYLFSTAGQSEIYQIAQHTAASTTATLATPFSGTTATAASFSVWNQALALPVNCRETFEVRHDFSDQSLDNHGLQKYRQIVAINPKEEGKPRLYTTTDYKDPDPYATISGIPAVSTRGSEGLVKTLVFASSVADHLSEGDRVEISGGGNFTYNGEFIIRSVSTTTATYTGLVHLKEAATSDTGFTVNKLSNKLGSERYRELLIHPSITDTRITLHVDYIKEATPLVNDADEPWMPLEDRVVLLYGVLERTWIKKRNPDSAVLNSGKYQAKLARMMGKLDDSTDFPVIRVSKNYLGKKRGQRRAMMPYANLWKIS